MAIVAAVNGLDTSKDGQLVVAAGDATASKAYKITTDVLIVRIIFLLNIDSFRYSLAGSRIRNSY